MSKFNDLPTAFVGKAEHLYILRNEGLTNRDIPKKYAVYSSTNAYNTRSETPDFIDAADALADFNHEIKIYQESLTTTPPVYETERDETDYGLTPERNIWRNRFHKAKGARSYAA